MDETVLKIAIAAFMHDIGKLADEGTPFVSEQFLKDNADLYQPFYEGRYSHKHAVYTAAFIDHIEKLLPREFNQARWGLEDTFINLAAGHHKPQTPMQWIIAMADRISSGWDRVKFDEEYNRAITPLDYKKTRLFPIFERLMLEDQTATHTSSDYSYCYPLKQVSPSNIFPILQEKARPADNKAAALEYKVLFDEFVFNLERLLHKEENLQLWFEHFESLLMIFSSPVPAARVGNVIPDVSLYDHLKTTSALAVALYLYHREKDKITVEAIKDYERRKFLLISGDFYGIQNFIFSDSGTTAKNRSKILRGRSFAVSLFSELTADLLCREIGIPSSSIVLNAAGKFTIVAPNTDKTRKAIVAVETRVNEWLMEVSFGENAIGLSFIEASAEDFVHAKFSELWDNLAKNMEKKKCKKIDLECFGGAVSGYLDNFRNDLGHPLCPFCGKRPSAPEVEGSALVGENESACKICRDHIFLGTNLVKKDRLAITSVDADIKGDDTRLLEPIFGYYQVAFVDGGMKDMARAGKLLKYWDISIDPEGRVSKDVTAKFINGYVPTYREEDLNDDRLLAGKKSEAKKQDLINQLNEGAPKTFGHIANKALNIRENGKGFCGIEALGVLKADVDQFGLLMSCGLKPERFTLSRLATLSRQLNWYFALYLPHLLKTNPQFMDIYTVFAGGDDLFLIGPWNRVIELASLLRQTFAEYVCSNQEIHFSAGISLHKPHTPLDKLEERAKAAIAKSKEEGRNRFTLFSETAEWDQYIKLQTIKDILLGWYDEKLINNAMIYRLNDFIRMAETERIIQGREEIHLDDMQCLKWHALFDYTAQRNVGKGLKGKEKEEMVREFSKAAIWLKEYGGTLRMALWNIIYNQRKEA